MKLILTVLMIKLFCINIFAQQNLVPNESFEDIYSCPNLRGEIDDNSKNWFTPWSFYDTINNSGSSDLFHKCGSSPVGIPNNSVGYSLPNNGNAYAGISLFYHNTAINYYDFSEYIEVELINPLLSNKIYKVELYYTFAEYLLNGYNNLDFSIGFILTDTIVKRLEPNIVDSAYPKSIRTNSSTNISLPNTPDTANWLKMSTLYKSNGGEKYLTIGFFESINSSILDTLSYTSVYLFIDDVKLYYYSEDTTQTTKELEIPNIFTPNGDGFNDVFEYKNQEDWDIETQIFNRWGELLFSEKNINWDGKYKGKKVSEGVYFYKINAKALRGGEIKVFNGAVHVIYN